MYLNDKIKSERLEKVQITIDVHLTSCRLFIKDETIYCLIF